MHIKFSCSSFVSCNLNIWPITPQLLWNCNNKVNLKLTKPKHSWRHHHLLWSWSSSGKPYIHPAMINEPTIRFSRFVCPIYIMLLIYLFLFGLRYLLLGILFMSHSCQPTPTHHKPILIHQFSKYQYELPVTNPWQIKLLPSLLKNLRLQYAEVILAIHSVCPSPSKTWSWWLPCSSSCTPPHDDVIVTYRIPLLGAKSPWSEQGLHTMMMNSLTTSQFNVKSQLYWSGFEQQNCLAKKIGTNTILRCDQVCEPQNFVEYNLQFLL